MDAQSITKGIARISAGSRKVQDVDEEVFLLYTRLAGKKTADGSEPFGGLGFVDARKPTINVRFELKDSESEVSRQPTPSKKQSRRRKRSKSTESESVVFEVELSQDTTALRSRKGDTGSVLWRLSVCFAQMVLQQYHYNSGTSLLDPELLSSAHVLELGAGTGLLSIVLSPLVHLYTATDIAELIPLIRKNITQNVVSSILPRVNAEELDWLRLQSATSAQRLKFFAYPEIDLLLVVDCIYHPSLLPALVETICHLATKDRTVVFVAAELRAEGVIEEFLRLWLGNGECWEIWSVGEVLLDPSYPMWIGSKLK